MSPRGLATAARGSLAALTLSLTALLGSAFPSEGQSVAELQSDLLEAIGTGWGDATWSALVVSLDGGDTLFAVEPDLPMSPASNMKLVTTAAALHVLGPEYRFRTWILADGPIVDGVLQGDLVLYGTGDPGISDRYYGRKDEVFQRLIDDLAAAGIERVAGDLVADASFFPGPLRDPGWDARDLNEHFSAGVSALSFNENVVSFRIQAADDGQQPLVETVPAQSALEIVNVAEMTTGRARPRLAILRDDPYEPVRIEGRMVTGTTDVWRQMTVAIPAEFFAASFHAALEARAIHVDGAIRAVDAESASPVTQVYAPGLGRTGPRVVAVHHSRPLIEYLEVVNKQSNNLFAELVFRAVGRAVEGSGSPQASARAVRRTLTELGVDVAGLIQVDGSGLAADNRVSTGTFVQLMERMSDGPLWDEFWATLPEAGARRELGRMYRTPAAGNLRAKTGTIEGVSALSGMVRSHDGERLAFSLMVNRTRSQNRAKRAENEIGARLAAFTRPAGTLPEIRAEDAAPIRSTAFADRHRVARGESLSGIAIRYGVSVDAILGANPRLDRDRISAGQWLDLPRPGPGTP